MSINIAGFVKSLIPTLSKSDIESDMQVSMDSLQVAISTYEDFQATQEANKIASSESKAIVLEFYKEYSKSPKGPKLSNTKMFAKDIHTLLLNMRTNGELVQKEISDITNEVIVSNALTAFKTNLLRAVSHYYFITRYLLDLCNYIYVHECKQGGIDLSNSAKPNAKQVQFVEKNMWLFARLIAVYGQDHGEFKEQVESLSGSVLPKDEVDEVLELQKSHQVDLFSNLPAGFVGSPIYSVRLVFAQWEADRYRQLKDKKKLLELRALHLRLVSSFDPTGGDAAPPVFPITCVAWQPQPQVAQFFQAASRQFRRALRANPG